MSATFRVTVPLNTPAGDTVYLVGDSHELGSDLDPIAVPMTQVPTNPWLWEATVTFDSAKNVTYRYTRGAFTNTESETRTLDIAYDGQSVNDAVFSWVDIPFSLSREFMAAIFPDDLWDPEYLPLYEPTLTSIKSLNAQYVVVSSVWSYGQVEPLPEVEPRAIRAPSVFTPTEDLIATIDMAHSMGMKVFIFPQFNMEMTPGGERVWGTHPNEWWDRWLEEAEKFYLYNAEIAQRTGAEMLLLPGPVFQAFQGEWAFEDPSYISVFDQKMMDLIGKVRQHYSGLLVVSGSYYSLYDFPSLADYVDISPFDMGVKFDVSSEASVQEIKRALENA
ncbi:MAG: carbohydrate-binding module family 20 domain-containing protein, partial [Chloroflexota bacterium]|nr:carbohydrate-binding module family 20 domain-containing protein [Chloroflexota bacterium]